VRVACPEHHKVALVGDHSTVNRFSHAALGRVSQGRLGSDPSFLQLDLDATHERPRFTLRLGVEHASADGL
jgi:hypothetical protein